MTSIYVNKTDNTMEKAFDLELEFSINLAVTISSDPN